MCDSNIGMGIVRLLLVTIIVAISGTYAAYEYDRYIGLREYCRNDRAEMQHIKDTTCVTTDRGKMKGTARDCEDLETKLRGEDVKMCATREWWDRHTIVVLGRLVVESIIGQGTAVLLAIVSGMALMAALIYFVIRLTSSARNQHPYELGAPYMPPRYDTRQQERRLLTYRDEQPPARSRSDVYYSD